LAATVLVTVPRVALVGVGGFGEHVSRLLARRQGGCEIVAPAVLQHAFADAPAVTIVALWRPWPSLCDRVDDLAFRSGRPWLPIVVEHPHLLVGPWIEPGSGACYRCYQARRVQHDIQHKVTSALAAAYERNPACGPAGYLPHHARIAAGLAELALRRGLPDQCGGRDASVVGEAYAVSLLTGQTSAHRVIACHGCTRCGPGDQLGGGLVRAAPMASRSVEPAGG
jgi:bacteriocin biosynthesis cyclodehydratase domain-containing protein